jgi:hypothetical protein
MNEEDEMFIDVCSTVFSVLTGAILGATATALVALICIHFMG